MADRDTVQSRQFWESLRRPPDFVRPTVRFETSYEEYVRVVEDELQSEWVDGWVTVFGSPTLRHAQNITFLMTHLRFYLDWKSLGSVWPPRTELMLREGCSFRQPDLMVIATEHAHRMTSERMIGPVDWICEVVSNDSYYRDVVEKRPEYEASGIPEYWMIDARSAAVEIVALRLDSEGRYRNIKPDDRGRFHSSIIDGWWLDPAWVTGDEDYDVTRAIAQVAPDWPSSLHQLA